MLHTAVLSFVEIGQVVPEKKIFEEFLPCMGVVAKLSPPPPPYQGGSTYNVALISQAVMEMFEIVNGRRMDDGPWYTISSPMSHRLR